MILKNTIECGHTLEANGLKLTTKLKKPTLGLTILTELYGTGGTMKDKTKLILLGAILGILGTCGTLFAVATYLESHGLLD